MIAKIWYILNGFVENILIFQMFGQSAIENDSMFGKKNKNMLLLVI